MHRLLPVLLHNKEEVMITKKTLMKWRKEALHLQKSPGVVVITATTGEKQLASELDVLNDRILILTQELIDQKLMEE